MHNGLLFSLDVRGDVIDLALEIPGSDGRLRTHHTLSVRDTPFRWMGQSITAAALLKTIATTYADGLLVQAQLTDSAIDMPRMEASFGPAY